MVSDIKVNDLLADAALVKVLSVTLAFAVLLGSTVGDVMSVSDLDVVRSALGEGVSVTEYEVKLGEAKVGDEVSATVVDVVLKCSEEDGGVNVIVLDIPPVCDTVNAEVSVSELYVVLVRAVVDNVVSVTNDVVKLELAAVDNAELFIVMDIVLVGTTLDDE